MKYLKKYERLFESDGDAHEDDVVAPGHVHSWSDIKEVMFYLTDIGFELEEKKSQFLDGDGNKCGLDEAVILENELHLTKKVHDEDGVISRSGQKRDIYLSKWDDETQEMNEAVASFCSHFDDCYYSLTLVFDKWLASFVIVTPVDAAESEKARKEKIERQAKDGIVRSFEFFRNVIFNNFGKATKDALKKNKLGEGMWGWQGSFEDGFLLCALNTEAVRNKKQVLAELERRVENLKRLTSGKGKVELRQVSEADIDRLVKIYKAKGSQATPDYFRERYLGMMAYVVDFDYKALLAEEMK